MHVSEDPRLYKFFEAMHYSDFVLRQNYDELNSLIEHLEKENGSAIVRAQMICWTIIDTIHRIREVAQNIPGLSRRNEHLKKLVQETAIVEKFRNYVQHLRNELSKKEMNNFPVWGSFSWIDHNDPRVSHTAISGGWDGKTSFPSSVYDTVEKRWVSRTSLSIADLSCNIDPIYERTMSFTSFCLSWMKDILGEKVTLHDKVPVVSIAFVPYAVIPENLQD